MDPKTKLEEIEMYLSNMDMLNSPWNVLKEFVKETCKGRDESHGWEHMEAVAVDSVMIYINDYNMTDKSKLAKIITTAWLHDVYDHKYDKDGQLRNIVVKFGENTFGDEFKGIMNIIERISYSKENDKLIKNEKLDWEDVLTKEELEIRDIVSDADKCQALGYIGLIRCVQFTKERHPNKTQEEIKKSVNEHAKEKLLRLRDQFIRTKTGKIMASVLHEEFVDALRNFTNN